MSYHILKHKKYFASIHFSTEGEVFYANISGIKDLVPFEGIFIEKAEKVFIAAAEDHSPIKLL